MAVCRCSHLPDTLVSTLDMIVTKDVRVMVVGDTLVIQPAPPEDKLQSDGAEHEDVIRQHRRPAAATSR